MTLHLHIGAHKTATTHIQATQIRHRALLTEAGVRFVRPDESRALIGSGRRAAASMGPIPSIRRARAMRRLANLDDGSDRVLISDENSLGQCAEIFARALLYPTAARRLRIWRRLAARRDTIVYFSLRDYGAFLSGAYVQSINQAAVYQPNDEVLAKLLTMTRRWPDVLADVRRAMPGARVRCWAYEDYGLLAPRLLAEMTGLSLSPVRRRPMATPSHAAVIAYRTGPPERRPALSTLAEDHPITSENPKFSLWSTEQAAVLSGMYQSDLAAIRRDLGEDFLSV